MTRPDCAGAPCESRAASGKAASSVSRPSLFVAPLIVIGSGRALVDGDVLLAPGVEGAAPPVGPARAQRQAREARHQVQLRGPRVAHLDGEDADAALVEDDVAAAELLPDGVVLVCAEADALLGHVEEAHAAARAQLREVRHEGFD